MFSKKKASVLDQPASKLSSSPGLKATPPDLKAAAPPPGSRTKSDASGDSQKTRAMQDRLSLMEQLGAIRPVESGVHWFADDGAD